VFVFAGNQVFAGTGNTLTGNNNAQGFSNVFFTAGKTLTIQAGSLSVRPSFVEATASNDLSGTGNNVGGANSALANSNVRLFSGGGLTIETSAGGVSVRASSASAGARNSGAAGNTVTATNTATAHASALVASVGDMSVKVAGGGLTVQGSSATASGSGGIANANANAALFSLGAKTVNVSGAVNLTGGFLSNTGPGATSSAFAMIDPASLDLTAGSLVLTPNDGGVVLGASGPTTLTVNGANVPLSSLSGPGVTTGDSTLTSRDPVIVAVNATSFNLTNLFGLPVGFLPQVVLESSDIDPCQLAPDICKPPLSTNGPITSAGDLIGVNDDAGAGAKSEESVDTGKPGETGKGGGKQKQNICGA